MFKSLNRYEILNKNVRVDDVHSADMDQSNQDVMQNKDQQIKTGFPPPIYVNDIEHFKLLADELSKIIGPTNFSCKSFTKNVKIQSTDSDSYRKSIHFLKSNGAECHCYQLRENKPFRVVIQNLHPSTDPNDIRSELESLNYEIRQVTNVSAEKTQAVVFTRRYGAAEEEEAVRLKTSLKYLGVVLERKGTIRLTSPRGVRNQTCVGPRG